MWHRVDSNKGLALIKPVEETCDRRNVPVVKSHAYDAVVIGSGPNGLAAAITMAQEGKSVVVYEAQKNIGGGARSAELTLPGFVHDICSSVYPLAIGSPFFRALPLAQAGLEWIQPPAAVAHPFDDGTAVTQERSVEATAAQAGIAVTSYRRLRSARTAACDRSVVAIVGPVPRPRDPLTWARCGLLGMPPASRLAAKRAQGTRPK